MLSCGRAVLARCVAHVSARTPVRTGYKIAVYGRRPLIVARGEYVWDNVAPSRLGPGHSLCDLYLCEFVFRACVRANDGNFYVRMCIEINIDCAEINFGSACVRWSAGWLRPAGARM